MVNGFLSRTARILALGMIIIAQMPVSVTVASAATLTPEDTAKYSEFLKAKPTNSWLSLSYWMWTAKDFLWYYTDSDYASFIKEMKSANPPTAQAIAQKGTEGLTEEQKKEIRCKDAIYAAGADECKTATAVSEKHELGAAPTATAVPDAIYQEIKSLPASGNFSGWSKEPKIYTKQAGEIKSDYIEAVFYGACNKGNALCMGVKVKEGTADDKWATIDIQRATPWNPRIMNIGLYGKSVVFGDSNTNMEDVANIKYYTQNGWRILEVQGLNGKLKADGNDYVFATLAGGSVMEDKLLDKNLI